MNDEAPAYGLWFLVVLNTAIFIIFAFSFFRPRTKRDWRSFGAFSGFLLALFTEMYGFPLTIYLLSGWLQSRYPGLDLFAHDAGHLPETLLGFKGDPHASPLHVLSYVLIFGGFIVLASAWKVLHQAQRSRRLATSGLYGWVRHPQYDAFILIMAGFLVQWPTILTVVMFPILVTMYVRLAHREERETLQQFGEAYGRYTVHTPGFIPRIRSFTRAPGFPLDSAGTSQATSWKVTGNWKHAVSNMASAIASLLIFWGILQIFAGNWVEGLWTALIGWFVKIAAGQSYHKAALREVLAGHTAREIMTTDCPRLSRRITLDEAVEHAVMSGGRRCFPVEEGGRFYGLLTWRDIQDVPRDRWTTTPVEQAMVPVERLKTARPGEELSAIMERMAAEDLNQLPVTSNGHLLGMVARDNLLSFLQRHGSAADEAPPVNQGSVAR
ncbi:MAG: CBS domain-containing protein [Chloroflexota bacterium]|nr:CBS domain-containing protein [Chloroflexota bacterium]